MELSKNALIKGTIILTLAAFVARFLGLIQRVPLKHLLEDAGMATYGIAYNIYFVLLTIAIAGIPSALSKLISERTALGHYSEARRIFRASSLFALATGILMTLILWLGADYYAVHISRDADAGLAIRALAPALLLFPLIAMMRGYFLGRQMMMASGISQIVEQIMRVVTAVGLAFVLLYFGFSKQWAIAGASFGGVMGAVGAFAVVLYYWQRTKRNDMMDKQNGNIVESESPRLPVKRIYGLIFRLSIPISLISIAVPMIYLVDSSTVIALLENRVGYDAAKETLGILTGRAQSLAGIPPILAIAISQSIVPIISAAYAKQDMDRVQSQSSNAFRLSVLLCLPLVIVLCIAARPINGLLFGDTQGTSIIITLTISIMFQIMMMISGAILMGMGQAKAPMQHVFVGLALKLIGSMVLAPLFGIYGIIAATALCFSTIMLLNMRTLRKTVPYRILGGKWWTVVFLAIVMIVIGVGVEVLLNTYVQFQVMWLTYGLHAALLGIGIGMVYIYLLFKMKLITEADQRHLPAPLRKVISKLF